jgi:mannose-1-phosphate guanylyltransferase
MNVPTDRKILDGTTGLTSVGPLRGSAGVESVTETLGATGNLWGLVLAGGEGKRLQRLTRAVAGAPIPKQYCRIRADRSLLEGTLMRTAALIPPARTLVIITRHHLSLAREQLAPLPTGNVVVQPSNRDTGPGLLLALQHLHRRAPGATVVMFPSDHHIQQETAFLRCVTRAVRIVTRLPEKIALLGIPPDRPERGFGYVRPGCPLALAGAAATFNVEAFVEKPSALAAARLVAEGALWNSFVMVFRVGRILQLLARVLPSAASALPAESNEEQAVEIAYLHLAPWNVSGDLLPRITKHLVMVRADDIGWSDWGTPEAVERTFAAQGWEMPWQHLAIGAD